METPRATVILIRHADTDGGTATTTALNAAGLARAETLRRVLADAGIAVIFVSSTRRSQQTAELLAGGLHIVPEVIGGDDLVATVAPIVAAIGALPADSTALVVGHSNTVGRIIGELGGPAIPSITTFDNLYVLTGNRLTHLHYGA